MNYLKGLLFGWGLSYSLVITRYFLEEISIPYSPLPFSPLRKGKKKPFQMLFYCIENTRLEKT